MPWQVKVKRYGIECPYQRLMVAKYEGMIDWHGARIESPETLNNHIADTMLSALREKTDPQSEKPTQYCRAINLDQMLANPAEHIRQASALREKDGDEAARRFLLDHINGQKRKVFEAWWTYLSKDNPEYADNYAFQYLMLRPVIESSGRKSTRAPVNPNAEALASLYDDIREGLLGANDNLLRVLCEYIAFGDRVAGEQPAYGTACGWVTVTRNAADAANRVAALSRGSGWCVASPSMAASYLTRSDFHLLLEAGRPVAAIRVANDRAVEVQGRQNQDPGPWWPRLLLYLLSRGWQILKHSYYEAEANRFTEKVRKEIAKLENNPAKLAAYLRETPASVQFSPVSVMESEDHRLAVETAWLSCARADPLSLALAPDWLARDPALVQAAIQGWKDNLELDPTAIVRMPSTLQQHPDLQAELVLVWGLALLEEPWSYSRCPKHFQKEPDIQNAVVGGWKSALARDPEMVAKTPPQFRRKPELARLCNEKWICALDSNPMFVYKSPKQRPRDPAVVNAVIRSWISLLNSNPLEVVKIPDDLRRKPEMASLCREKWIRALRRSPRLFHKCPDDLRGDPEIIDVSVAAWARLLLKDPRKFNDCPVEIKETERIVSAAVNGWCNSLRKYPGHILALPDEFQPHQALFGFRAQAWGAALEVDNTLYHHCPQDLRNEAAVLDAVVKGGINAMSRPGSNKKECEIMQEAIRLSSEDDKAKIMLNEHWIKEIEKQNGDIKGVPDDILKEPMVRERVASFWKKPCNTRDFLWADWRVCPDFVREGMDSAMARRAATPLTRELRRHPKLWLDVIRPWRNLPELREEAAMNWAFNDSCEEVEPPEDIRARVMELRAAEA